MASSFSKISASHCFWHVTFLSCIFWIAAYFHRAGFCFTSRSPRPDTLPADTCSGRYVYVHDLPSRFNSDILFDYHNVNISYTNMCRFISNAGLGPALNVSNIGVLSSSGWYATDPYALDLIFHNRMKRYECLTTNSSLASAIFVPFYAGLDFGRYQWDYNISVRDSLSLDLVNWLSSKPEWAPMGGRDHFMVAGRTTWDFRRFKDEDNLWGNKLLLLTHTMNMSTLVFESSPWDSNDFAIPYPTYFHPSCYSVLVSWQDKVRSSERQWLFSFAGAPRLNRKDSIRGEVIEQCRASAKCNLMECGSGLSECHSPGSVMSLFETTTFCLQPQGDTPTRRSVFDSMVAGCVPVFFHPRTAYDQYTWYLPREHDRYSVFIAEDEVRRGEVSIEEVLSGYSEEQVRAMRDEVVRLIPRLIYGDPRSRSVGFKDAFDVAVEGILQSVAKIRR
ncbi:hypothetical protein J5N97_007020 [Dioscorea zingiberensis]|uniref:Exostosin GT47 domain-containing protein n=1 Tax=Dioscorea zingiberensis TaxID=325984 RepID=A0A9D5DBU8_9LILI|nr:hypothetical protein J5N97_007020 [Dioscorea zingiberensis]